MSYYLVPDLMLVTRAPNDSHLFSETLFPETNIVQISWYSYLKKQAVKLDINDFEFKLSPPAA